ncbi:MAG: chromosome segregation protein SMC [Chloroflexota bacterium]|nr:chromosome segregation protein SMC [Chloroflexota bacterium]
MYLKRLDVQGFKSFASRTAFEFGPGTTAVVGPNGAGKSNVADALRWVLGEQSGRLLRARRLEEVIFAGSSRRSATNAAEVTITLDNSDRWLPLDFAEVAVTRRARRSGESDYFINRKRVRLKDVTDLFLRASASQSSFAIIGQGLVETVLSLRPEERRLLLEEAADVQRYRLKIEEGQTRLAATRDNMERVQLLAGEIAPRLSQLERQARRAARHGELSQELTDALRAWYSHLWQREQEALAAAQRSLERSRQEEARAEAEIKTWDEQLAAVREELASRRSAISDRAVQRQRLSDQITLVQERIATARQRHGGVIGRRQQLQIELEAMEKEMLNLARASVEESRRSVALEEELETSRRVLSQSQQEMESLEQESSGMQRQAATGEEKAARGRAAVSDAEARLRNIADARSLLDEERSQQEARRRALVSQMAAAARDLSAHRAEEKRLNEAMAAALQEQDALRSRIAKEQASLLALQESCRSRDLEMERLQARLNVLTDAQQAHDARTRATTAPILEAADIPVHGLLGVVSSIIRVPKGLDRAIEAALAENLQAMLVERQKDALAAIQDLAKQEVGRVVIFPLDSLKELYPLNIVKERGVVGVASRLVKCEERYRKLVDTLLGRTIVVDDLETALRVLRRGMGNVVTRDGILLHPLGSISTGRPTSEGNVFTRHQELASIPRAIERIARSREAAEEELQRLRTGAGEDESALHQTAETLMTIQEQRAKAQDAIAQGRRLLAQLRGEMRWLITSQQRSAQQAASLTLEGQRLEEEKERLLAQAAEAQEVAQYLRSAGGMLGERRQALLQKVTEASTNVASLDGELRSLALLRETRQATLSKLDAQMTAKQAELRGIELESTSLTDNVDADWRDVEKLTEELKSYAREVDPAQQAIATLQDQEREAQAKVAAAQSRLLQAERQRLEAEAEMRHRREDLDNLRQRIEADGLTVTHRGEVVVAGIAEEAARAEGVPAWMRLGDGDGNGQTNGQTSRLPPIAGGALIDPQTMQERIQRLRGQLRALGPVNPQAETDYEELKERHTFLTVQLADLETAERSLLQAIDELDEVICQRFGATFHQVAEQFSRYFTTFFGGGQAKLVLTTPDDYHSAGVDIVAQPPGKRLQSLGMLSGGEKALTAVALLFALLQANPSPFCVLDEVDAMLDEANVGRFVAALQEMAQRSQFIVITHNRRTIEVADSIYGISMGEDSISRVLSLRLNDISPN